MSVCPPRRLQPAARLTEMPEDALLDSIDEALYGVPARRRRPGETYTFAHAIVRHTVYDRLPSRRVRTRARQGGTLRGQPRAGAGQPRHAVHPGGAGGDAGRARIRPPRGQAPRPLAFDEGARAFAMALAPSPGLTPTTRRRACCSLADSTCWPRAPQQADETPAGGGARPPPGTARGDPDAARLSPGPRSASAAGTTPSTQHRAPGRSRKLAALGDHDDVPAPSAVPGEEALLARRR
jgi:hypothetical protein